MTERTTSLKYKYMVFRIWRYTDQMEDIMSRGWLSTDKFIDYPKSLQYPYWPGTLICTPWLSPCPCHSNFPTYDKWPLVHQSAILILHCQVYWIKWLKKYVHISFYHRTSTINKSKISLGSCMYRHKTAKISITISGNWSSNLITPPLKKNETNASNYEAIKFYSKP